METALVMPIVLICMMLVLNQGIALYTDTVRMVQEQGAWEGMDPAKKFWELEWMDLLSKSK